MASGMKRIDLAWPSDGHKRLRSTRAARRHSQADTLAWIRDHQGITPTQPQYSTWESGRRKPQGHNRWALLAYLQEFSPTIEEGVEITVDNPLEATSFEASVRELTDEPLLGPLQHQLLEAAIERHRIGPPLSPSDHLVWRDMAAALRLPVQPEPSG